MSAADEAAGLPLRISYLFSQFPVPTQTFARSDIAALGELGHAVVVHTIKPRPAGAAGRSADQGAAILRPGLLRALAWPALLWRRRAQSWRLVRLILPHLRRSPLAALASLACLPRVLEITEEVIRNRSEVVHVFWSRQAALVLPVLDWLGVPAVRSSFVGAYDLVADDFLIDIALDHSHLVFSHAETNRPYVERKAPAGVPVHIIHRGIPLPAIGAETGRDRSLWVTASALVKDKNVAGVLRAFAYARSQQPAPELQLVVCGDGPERDALRRLAGDLGCAGAVRFAGHIDREELFALMQQAGVFMMLSKKASERLPNVVKEALWSGCFVITSNSPGIEELIPDASIGQVADPDDEAAVHGAVDLALGEDGVAAARRIARTRAMIAANFSNLASMARYVSAWRQALGARAGSDRRG